MTTNIEQTLHSWLLDSQQIVSSKRISLTFSIPRSEARNILLRTLTQYLSVENNPTTRTYKCTVYGIAHDSSSSSLSMYVKSDVIIPEDEIYALSVLPIDNDSGCDSLDVNAKEAMRCCVVLDKECQKGVNHRDVEGSYRKIQCATIRPYSIDGSKTVPDIHLGSVRHGSSLNGSSVAHQQGLSDKTVKRKVTSAASFFGTSSGSSQTSKKSTTAKTNTDKKLVSMKTKQQNRRVLLDSDEDEDVEINRSITDNKSVVGNVDDFIGDEDEDEDEEDVKEEEIRKAKREALVQVEEDEKRSKRSKVARAIAEEKRRKKPNDTNAINCEDGNEEKEKTVGAMDSFIGSSNDDASSSKKIRKVGERYKRRKKMVQKTTMDAKGYLHTEFVEEWVDMSDNEGDEEVENKKPIGSVQHGPLTSKTVNSSGSNKSKKTVSSSKGMKQTGLMGFFAKKK